MAKKRKKSAKRKASKKSSKRKPMKAVSAAKPLRPSVPAYHSELLKGIKTSGKNRLILIGTWAMIVSVLVAVVLALAEAPLVAVALIIVGFVVGFLNFEHEETVKFLVAIAGLLVVAIAILMTGFSRLEIVYPVAAVYLRRAAYNLISVSAPALFVLSLKALRELAE